MRDKQEMDRRVQEMMAERNQQDAELRQRYNFFTPQPFKPPTNVEPFTKEQMDHKVREMMEARRQQDLETQRYNAELRSRQAALKIRQAELTARLETPSANPHHN